MLLDQHLWSVRLIAPIVRSYWNDLEAAKEVYFGDPQPTWDQYYDCIEYQNKHEKLQAMEDFHQREADEHRSAIEQSGDTTALELLRDIV